MSTDPGARTLIDLSGEAPADGLRDAAAATGPVDMHRRLATRLLLEGAPLQGLNELLRASRALPMSGRLAGALTRLALAAQTHGPALLVLNQRLDGCAPADRLSVLRHLARLARHAGSLEESREALRLVLAEVPGDRRARAALNALLEREGRWDELDVSLEQETREAAGAGRLLAASRASLRRARLWDEQRQQAARAATHYAQAADFAEQAQRPAQAFPLRLLALRAQQRGQASRRALEEAAHATLEAAQRVGQLERARALLRELGLTAEPVGVGVRRASTQLELMAIADDVARTGRATPEVAAVLAAATREGPDPRAAQRLEAHYVQRGAWRELARLYEDAAARAATKPEKASWCEKLAELLESELDDAQGAARAWAEVVAATGDARAVAEQVRLLSGARDHAGLRRALDEGVQRAPAGLERARALVLRAEAALTHREVAGARRDFEAALQLAPGLPEATAGLAELAVVQGDFAPVRELERALAAMPRRAAGRGELFRRLARLAGPPVGDVRLARLAWAEVLAELPGDEEATARQLALLRAAGDDVALRQALEAFLARAPRGPRSREAWLELVALCDRAGLAEEGLAVLKKAVRVEPGHRAAWLAYADRLEARGERDAEVAWALEHAATATEDEAQRLSLWRRLARHAREALGDDAMAQTFAQRAERLEVSLAEAPPSRTTSLPGGPLVVPRPRALRPPEDDAEDDAENEGTTSDLEFEALGGATPAGGADLTRSLAPDAGEVSAFGDGLEGGVDDEPGELRAAQDEEAPGPASHRGARQTQEIPVPLGDPGAALPPSFGPAPSKALSAERRALFERVRQAPLEPDGYRLLAEHFDSASDPGRSSLMLEIARALEGDPNAAPRTPRLILNATDRAGLKHPSLRGEPGELMALVGAALCRLYPTTGRSAGSDEEFHLEAGKGAKAAADALLAGVRILGQRAPEVFLSEDPGPPFALTHPGAPRLLVGRLAVKRETDPAELRFFAGRALFTLQPELLALRSLRREQVLKGLQLIADVAAGRAQSAEARVAKEAVSARAWDRVRQLVARVGRTLDYAQLVEGARASANRAGLVVCGGVAPAVAALRAKRALPAEMMSLVRFAASERYLQLRSRQLPQG
jgi:hypothetical protein